MKIDTGNIGYWQHSPPRTPTPNSNSQSSLHLHTEEEAIGFIVPFLYLRRDCELNFAILWRCNKLITHAKYAKSAKFFFSAEPRPRNAAQVRLHEKVAPLNKYGTARGRARMTRHYAEYTRKCARMTREGARYTRNAAEMTRMCAKHKSPPIVSFLCLGYWFRVQLHHFIFTRKKKESGFSTPYRFGIMTWRLTSFQQRTSLLRWADYATLFKEGYNFERIIISDIQLPLKPRGRSPPRCAH